MDTSRLRTVMALSLPIIGGMVSQNVLNLVDTAMVGQLGDTALAATGMGSFANFVSVAFITGMGSGVQAMVARRKGEGRDSEVAVPLNGGLLMALGLALPLCALLYLLAPTLFPLLVDDPAVQAVGTDYYRLRLIGVAAVGMNFAFRGYWNGVGLSKMYLGTLIVMHTVNIFLNWVLIFGKLGMPAMGAPGAGLATSISVWAGSAVYVFLCWRHARPQGFLRGLPDRGTLLTMLRLAVPAGIQQELFAAGYLSFFWIVGQVGTRELAAANVLLTLTLVAVLPGLGFGLGAASLVGQALGRGDPEDARRWGWEVVRIAAGVMGLLGLPMLFAPDAILGVFLEDPDTLALAVPALQIVGGAIVFDAVGMVLLNALLGAGAARQVMAVAVGAQWLVGLPLAWLVGPVLGWGLTAIWASQVGWRVLQAGVFALLWQRGDWQRIRL